MLVMVITLGASTVVTRRPWAFVKVEVTERTCESVLSGASVMVRVAVAEEAEASC